MEKIEVCSMIKCLHLKGNSVRKSMMKGWLCVITMAHHMTLLWGGKGLSKLDTCPSQTNHEMDNHHWRTIQPEWWKWSLLPWKTDKQPLKGFVVWLLWTHLRCISIIQKRNQWAVTGFWDSRDVIITDCLRKGAYYNTLLDKLQYALI